MAGTLLGVALASLRYSLPRRIQGKVLTNFLFEWFRFPPPIAWLPFIVIFFGISFLSSIIVVVLAVFPIMLTHTYEGMVDLPAHIKRTGSSLNLSKRQLLLHLYFPYLLPNIFTGLRLSLGLGWMSVIASEMISAEAGLGYLLQVHRLYLQFSKMILDIVVISIVGYGMHLAVSLLDRKYSWRRL